MPFIEQNVVNPITYMYCLHYSMNITHFDICANDLSIHMIIMLFAFGLEVRKLDLIIRRTKLSLCSLFICMYANQLIGSIVYSTNKKKTKFWFFFS